MDRVHFAPLFSSATRGGILRRSVRSVLCWSPMAAPKKAGFSNRSPDHITDELVNALGKKGSSFEFKDLFLLVFAGLKLKKAASGGNEMLRLRCYEKLGYLVNRG